MYKNIFFGLVRKSGIDPSANIPEFDDGPDYELYLVNDSDNPVIIKKKSLVNYAHWEEKVDIIVEPRSYVLYDELRSGSFAWLEQHQADIEIESSLKRLEFYSNLLDGVVLDTLIPCLKKSGCVIHPRVYEHNGFEIYGIYEECGWANEKPIWCDVKEISVGHHSSMKGTPDRSYLITKNKEPYLVVKAFYEYRCSTPLHYDEPEGSCTLWQDFLFLGMCEEREYVCYINLETLEINTLMFDGYFDGFYKFSSFLFIASSSRIYCLDDKCSLVWKTEELGVDGVRIDTFVDNYLEVSGETDPPGGWWRYRIDITTGYILEREPAYTEYYWDSIAGWNHAGVRDRIANGDEIQIKTLHTCPTRLMRDLYPAILEGTLISKHKGAIALCEKICKEQNIKIDRRIYE
jgi:hypothetical protein